MSRVGRLAKTRQPLSTAERGEGHSHDRLGKCVQLAKEVSSFPRRASGVHPRAKL
jgi:hypothetical protein